MEENKSVKYRKLPVEIDAVQWFPGITVDGVEEFETGDAMFNMDWLGLKIEMKKKGWLPAWGLGYPSSCRNWGLNLILARCPMKRHFLNIIYRLTGGRPMGR